MTQRRLLNDDRRRRFGSPGRTLALLCECDDGCAQTVLATVEEYDTLRPGPIVHPGHPEAQPPSSTAPSDSASQLQ